MSAEGFYVTIRRAHRTGFLLGPYSTAADAATDVDTGRGLAHLAAPFAAFDAFGVTRVTTGPGHALPRGVLNDLAAAQAREKAAAGLCPECGGKLLLKWSGVECKACGWWFCH